MDEVQMPYVCLEQAKVHIGVCRENCWKLKFTPWCFCLCYTKKYPELGIPVLVEIMQGLLPKCPSSLIFFQELCAFMSSQIFPWQHIAFSQLSIKFFHDMTNISLKSSGLITLLSLLLSLLFTEWLIINVNVINNSINSKIIKIIFAKIK